MPWPLTPLILMTITKVWHFNFRQSQTQNDYLQTQAMRFLDGHFDSNQPCHFETINAHLFGGVGWG